MKFIKYIYIIVLFAFIASCTPMDDKYKQFVDDGPVTYIAKLTADSVLVRNGRKRVEISWPKSNDPRGKKAVIYWANKTGSTIVDINPTGRTQFIIDSLREGSYIFEIFIKDNLGNSSIATTVVGEAFGDDYEKYLINRAITKVELNANNAVLSLATVLDKTIVESNFIWKQGGETKSILATAAENTVTLDGFKAMSFQYNTVYQPTGAIDSFYSPYLSYVMNFDLGKVIYNGTAKTLTFPTTNDDNYYGVELKWQADGGEQTHLLKATDGFVANIPTYLVHKLTYRAICKFKDSETLVYSSETTKPTFSWYTRSAWAAIEVSATTENTPLAMLDGKDLHWASQGGVARPMYNKDVFAVFDMKTIQEIKFIGYKHRIFTSNIMVNCAKFKVETKKALTDEWTDLGTFENGIDQTVIHEHVVKTPASGRYVKITFLEGIRNGTTTNTGSVQCNEFLVGTY